MTRGDDYILQFFVEADIAASPNVIGYNIDYSRQYVARRCSTLADGGLLNRVDEEKAMYRITDLGLNYIKDQLTDEEIERVESAVDV
ncbi:MAG: MarR family transcriptional regulator [Halobacteriaceae archaeon]